MATDGKVFAKIINIINGSEMYLKTVRNQQTLTYIIKTYNY